MYVRLSSFLSTLDPPHFHYCVYSFAAFRSCPAFHALIFKSLFFFQQGRAACRQGDWKIVFIPKPKGTERWQLYNLVADPGETDDLAEAHPERLAHLIKLWDQYVLETGVIPLSPELGEYIAATELQMEENAWMEFDYWKPGARDAPEDPKFKRNPPRFKKEVKAF